MECPVCLDLYDQPVLLPGCGHTLCRHCASQILEKDNFLRCPECRLVYQLNQGIKSLPKNVALERSIDEHLKITGQTVMCEVHPSDASLLYCRTCELSICLRCYFTNLNKGESKHEGHQVDTCEDAFSAEKRLLQETVKKCRDKRNIERKYVQEMELAQDRLKLVLEHKLSAIDKEKEDLIKLVNQTSSKLKFTLKGTVARDKDFLQVVLASAKSRLETLETDIEEGDSTILKAECNDLEVNAVMEMRRKLELVKEPSTAEKPDPKSFLKIEKFDTDIKSCMEDARKALSYQTEPPRAPEILIDRCVISESMVYVVLQYNETVRVKKVTLKYKESMFKGMSETKWNSVDSTDVSNGKGHVVLSGLTGGTMYKMYAVTSNDFGDSPFSKDVFFRTLDGVAEIRVH